MIHRSLSALLPRLLAGLCRLRHDSAKGNQRNNVRKHHKLVEQIRQLPYKIIQQQRSEENIGIFRFVQVSLARLGAGFGSA